MTCCLLRTLANWPLSVSSTWRRVWHHRPFETVWPSATPYGTAVRSPRCHPPEVLFLPLRQVFPCAIQQPVIPRCLHCVLCASGVGARYVSFYLQYGVPCRRSQAAPSEHARMTLGCICTVVLMIQLLLSHGWRSTFMMSATGWPPTVSSWTQRRPNYSGLGQWVEVQCWGSAWQQWSVGAVWHRSYLCKWPRPCSRSNNFVWSLFGQAVTWLMSAQPAAFIGSANFDASQSLHFNIWKTVDRTQLNNMHWLDVPERIHYKVGVTVHRCVQNKAPC